MTDREEFEAWVSESGWNENTRKAIDSLLAEAGYAPDSSVRNLLGCMNFIATQPERKPMTKGQREQVARRAEAAMNGNVNLSWRDALISETEAFHDIKETP